MRRQAVAGVRLTALCAAAAVGVLAAPPPGDGPNDAGVTRFEALLPGPILDRTIQRRVGHADALVLLVRPAKAGEPPAERDGTSQGPPLQLWRLTPTAAEPAARLVRLRDDVDRRARTIQAWDTDGSGSQILVTVTPGTLVALPDDGGPTSPLLSDPGLLPRGARLRHAGSPARDVLTLATLGRARFLGRTEQQPTWEPIIEIDLRKSVTVRRHGLKLESRPPVHVGEAGGALHLATPPIPLSDRRLSGHHVAIDEADAVHVEWWAGLPGAEEVLEDAFIIYDGEPALLVTTRPSDKLELFGEKRLRLFRLRGDRSRMGHPPFFAVETRINLWQTVRPYVRDVNGDNADDLVLAYWKGLKDSRIVLDVYLGNGDGNLVRKPRTTAFDVKDADRSFIDFSGDLDGDGAVDLLLRTEKSLLVFSGSGGEKQGRLLASRPTHVATLSENTHAAAEIVVSVGGSGVQPREAVGGAPRPWIVDLDVDGHHEVVNLAPLADGRLRLTWVRFGD